MFEVKPNGTFRNLEIKIGEKIIDTLPHDNLDLYTNHPDRKKAVEDPRAAPADRDKFCNQTQILAQDRLRRFLFFLNNAII